MIRVEEIASMIEEFAPLSLQASYDNAGLIVGNPKASIDGVLIAVDLTEEVIEEAIEIGADMIVTHHPIIFTPLKRLTSANNVERCVELAIRHNIAVYAAHTNLDCAPDGMSWRVGDMLGLTRMEQLDDEGYGVVGDLPEPLPIEGFLADVATDLKIRGLRHSDIVEERVKRVAICTGAGGSLLSNAISKRADIYLTADLRYNDFFAAQRALTLVDIGHYESEYCVIDIIYDILSKKMINFALHKSLRASNPIHYKGY